MTGMPQRGAGILLFRRRCRFLEGLLVHPDGPYWSNKDAGALSSPKGVYEAGEDALLAAKREFREELGVPPAGQAVALGSFRQSSAKIVDVWAIEGDFDPAGLKSNTFSMEWPPRSGRVREIPEVDRAEWFSPAQASRKILKGQRPVVDALLRHLGLSGEAAG